MNHTDVEIWEDMIKWSIERKCDINRHLNTFMVRKRDYLRKQRLVMPYFCLLKKDAT